MWFLLILMAKKGLKVAYSAHTVALVMRCLGHKVVSLGRINQLLQNFSCQFKAGSQIFKKIQAYDALPVLVCHTHSLPGLPRCCGNAPPHLHSVSHSLHPSGLSRVVLLLRSLLLIPKYQMPL